MAVSLDNLNRVRYAGLDFNTHEDEILTRLQVNFASTYNDFSVSSLGIMLVDIFSFGLDTLSFYVDRRATDMFLSTARTRKSVARTARQLGYKMAPATASSVDVTINPRSQQPFVVTLPIGFQVKGPDESIFEARQTYSWAAMDVTPVKITFSQTQTLQSVFTSDGTANQVFKIANVPTSEFIVGPGSDNVSQVTVTVDGVGWTENELLTFGQTNQFEIGYNDSPPTLRFGDSIAGNIPASGAQIRITYFSSRGAAGSATAGTISTPVRPIIANFTSVDLSINNVNGTNGGSDPETIEKAKANAPTFFKARGVNITKEDYDIRAGSFVDSVFGAIAVAKAVTVRGSSTDAHLQNLLTQVTSTADTFVTTVATESNAIKGTITTCTSQTTTIQTANTTLGTALASLRLEVVNGETSSTTVNSSSGMVVVFVSQVAADAGTAYAAVNAIGTGGSDQLTTSTKTSLLNTIASIQSASSNANIQASTVNSEASAVSASLSNIKTYNSNAISQYNIMAPLLTSLLTNLSSASSAIDAMNVDVSLIDNEVADLAQQILDHVGGFLSSDCQSNLIEVPVLTFDSDGFYAIPTISLIRSLQTYLDAKKEITQVVKVVAASSLLVAADVTAHVGVLSGYVEATVRSQVEAQILNVLRGRSFGDDLQLSEIYWRIDPSNGVIKGVDFVKIKIVAPVANLDSDGNLSIQDTQVITKGTITVTSEVV